MTASSQLYLLENFILESRDDGEVSGAPALTEPGKRDGVEMSEQI